MNESLVVGRRFRGPPESGNGGYVAGLLAKRLGGTAEVTLRRPPPLERPLEVRAVEDGLVLADVDDAVAEARGTSLDVDLPDGVPLEDAGRAAEAYAEYEADHAFPECFVCGPRRGPDGLRIFPGPLRDRDLAAAPWTPDGSMAEEGRVSPEFVWAALDCPGAWGLLHSGTAPDGPIVLGRLAVDVVADVVPDTTYAVVGWAMGSERRKHFAGTALFDPGGRPVAAGSATWIRMG